MAIIATAQGRAELGVAGVAVEVARRAHLSQGHRPVTRMEASRARQKGGDAKSGEVD